MKKTKWFPPSIQPVYLGVYEIDDGDDSWREPRWFAHWNGSRFGYRATSWKGAFELRNNKTTLDKLTKWRGLAVEPKSGISSKS